MCAFKFDALEDEIPHLRRFARSLVRNPDKADDLVQDTLERAIRRHSSFETGTSLRAWLFTILRNLHIDQCRKAKRRGDTVEIDDFDTALSVAPAQGTRTELREFMTAFAALDQRDQDLLNMVAIDGLSYEAAAEIFDVQVGTIKSRLSRARARLRDLEEYGDPAVTAPPRDRLARLAAR